MSPPDAALKGSSHGALLKASPTARVVLISRIQVSEVGSLNHGRERTTQQGAPCLRELNTRFWTCTDDSLDDSIDVVTRTGQDFVCL